MFKRTKKKKEEEKHIFDKLVDIVENYDKEIGKKKTKKKKKTFIIKLKKNFITLYQNLSRVLLKLI